MQDLDALDVLRIVSVPKEPNYFALPTQDRPGRIVSQQRRALTIAHALVRAWLTNEPRRLAVIGAGFGGIAAALYAASEGVSVDLFEAHQALLGRFRTSNRYVDPRIADWPRSSWSENKSALHGIDWEGGPVSGLVERTLNALDHAQSLFNLRVHTGAEVSALPHDGIDRPRQLWWKSREIANGMFAPFDAVLICTGFGPEKMPNGWTGSDLPMGYWDAPKPLPYSTEVVIIGNGDGGLCELFILLGLPLEHQRELVKTLLAGRGTFSDGLAAFEDRWRFLQDTGSDDVSKEVTAEYFSRVGEQLAILPHGKLKLNYQPTAELANVTLLGQSKHLLSLQAFAVNRLTVAALLKPIDGDRIGGHYESRLALDGRRVTVRYLQASASVKSMNLGASTKDNHKEVELAVGHPDGVRVTMRCDMLIPRGGTEQLTNAWSNMMKDTFDGRRSTSQLNLLERSLPPHLLQRVHIDGEDFCGFGRDIFASEFYDSWVQRTVFIALGSDLKKLAQLYHGKLRLDIALWRTVRLSDTNLLDGVAFHQLLSDGEQSREILTWLKQGRLEVSSRAKSCDAALYEWLNKDEFPELSLLEAYPNLHASRAPSLEAWQRARHGGNGGQTWQQVLTKLSMEWQPARWLIDQYEAISKHLNERSFRPWQRKASQRAAFDALDLDLNDAKNGSPPYIDKLKKVMRQATRPSSTRTSVFQEVRAHFTDYQPLGESDKVSLDDFSSWYNSSYNYGIFHRDEIDRGEFIWLPRATRITVDTELSPPLCLFCVSDSLGPEFERRLLAWNAESRGNVKFRFPDLVERLRDWSPNGCPHVCDKSLNVMLAWLRPFHFALWEGRLLTVDDQRKAFSRTEPLTQTGAV